MPTYGYECTTCRRRFERKQKISEEPVRVCPECNGPTRRLVFPVGIIFKGSGWYITDSRGGSGDSASGIPAPAEAKGESGNGKGDATKSEPGKGEAKAATSEAKK